MIRGMLFFNKKKVKIAVSNMKQNATKLVYSTPFRKAEFAILSNSVEESFGNDSLTAKVPASVSVEPSEILA